MDDFIYSPILIYDVSVIGQTVSQPRNLLEAMQAHRLKLRGIIDSTPQNRLHEQLRAHEGVWEMLEKCVIAEGEEVGCAIYDNLCLEFGVGKGSQDVERAQALARALQKHDVALSYRAVRTQAPASRYGTRTAPYPQQQRQQQQQGSIGPCWGCGKEGHLRKDCPTQQRPQYAPGTQPQAQPPLPQQPYQQMPQLPQYQLLPPPPFNPFYQQR